MATVTIPQNITVHLGSPGDGGKNITVPFVEYIKNVASNEIYPTWPEEAIRANLLAQISYALNRIYTEWYPSMGYNYDITNDTRYDQSYKENGQIYESISQIADEVFNNYVVNNESVLPYFTAYCDGKRTQCEGLRQWGSLELAEQGYTAEEILKRYYGDGISVVYDAKVDEIFQSYPGSPLRLGTAGEPTYLIQRMLNRIAKNYPAIGEVNPDGYFGVETEQAVKNFQRIFNLAQDGIVGKATWYKIRRIYNGVMRLAELYSEPITAEESQAIFTEDVRLGTSGQASQAVQYYLQLISYFDDDVPYTRITPTFDENDVETLKAFQRKRGLPDTGVVNAPTWNEIVKAYNAIVLNSPENVKELGYEVYPGRVLTYGMTGEDVTALQNLLIRASGYNGSIPQVEITGVFDDATNTAVRAVQRESGLANTGAVGPITWDIIAKYGQ